MPPGRRLTAKGIVTAGQAMVHLLFQATSLGIIVRGPLQGAEQTFVLADDWLGGRPPASLTGERRAAALAELARRYLRGHGPASVADLALWAGLPQRDARAGLDAIARELRDTGSGRVDLASRPAVRRAPPPGSCPRSTPTCSAGATARSRSAASTSAGSGWVA